jgi:superoxide dismutase, Fe-Mn family
MAHVAKSFDHLIGKLPGLSEQQIRAHLGLYQGYVKKINEVEEKLKSADPATANYSFGEVSELLRRQGVPYNGAYLHQLYFENLNPNPSKPGQSLKAAIDSQWGSVEKWYENMKTGIMSGHGWVLLVRSRFDGTLRNSFVEEHHRNVLVEQDIVLAIDGWEHAYMIDYGTKKPDYISAVEKLLDWDLASRRYEASKNYMKVTS